MLKMNIVKSTAPTIC